MPTNALNNVDKLINEELVSSEIIGDTKTECVAQGSLTFYHQDLSPVKISEAKKTIQNTSELESEKKNIELKSIDQNENNIDFIINEVNVIYLLFLLRNTAKGTFEKFAIFYTDRERGLNSDPKSYMIL